MTDYAEHLVTIQLAYRELEWLLPEAKLGPAREKAILIEQAARAIVKHCKRQAAELDHIARGHSNMQVLSKPMVYAHIGFAAHDDF